MLTALPSHFPSLSLRPPPRRYVSVTEGNPTTLFPLVCVVGFEAFLTIIEDLVRVNADVASNSTPVERLVRGSKVLEQTTWANLVVGDIIKVRERGEIRERGAFLPLY